VDGVAYVNGSLLDPELLATTVENADVVFETISPRGDMEGRVEEIVDQLIRLADDSGVRLGVLGGVSSVLVSEGGPRFFDVSEPEPEVLPEIKTGLATLDWFYVSPAATFGAWYPQQVTGDYRISDDVLLTDEKGESHISGADLAKAVVDEIEQPKYHRRRFHAAH
jgi:putative NADH-flavin reductase